MFYTKGSRTGRDLQLLMSLVRATVVIYCLSILAITQISNTLLVIAQAVADVGTRSPITYDAEFFSSSIYRGAPNPELDAAWHNLTNGKFRSQACLESVQLML